MSWERIEKPDVLYGGGEREQEGGGLHSREDRMPARFDCRRGNTISVLYFEFQSTEEVGIFRGGDAVRSLFDICWLERMLLFDGHNGFEQLLYTPRRISSILQAAAMF
ncbi:hypothetical protein C4D60_Mb01t10560 [Musa balbisiana]|uniref:Uncharacterized protein n=1 Tax=Musa balbisiana TaxID=52838 RepID=A0A4S8JNP9_MUSBA|nr:hypothetical protein C4D60_Mb01t10560 [Musa balbisiana]